MSARPIDSLSEVKERLLAAIVAYVEVADRIIRMLEEEPADADVVSEMEAEG